jgi:hypothetical protein
MTKCSVHFEHSFHCYGRAEDSVDGKTTIYTLCNRVAASGAGTTTSLTWLGISHCDLYCYTDKTLPCSCVHSAYLSLKL